MAPRAILRRLVRAYLTLLAGAAGLAAPKRHLGGPPDRILVIRLDLLGDVLYTLNAVQALCGAFPGAEIDILVLPYTAPLVAASSFGGRVIGLDTNRVRSASGLIDPRVWREYFRVWRRLRARRYDVALSVAGRTASLVALLSGARRRIGYAGEAYPYVLTDPVPGGRFDRRMPEVQYVMRLLRPLGVVGDAQPVQLEVPPEAVVSVEAKLKETGIRPDDRLVVVHAGSVNGSAKRWPTESWARFADRVSAESGAKVVLAGAESDRELAGAVARASNATSFAGRTTVGELLALLQRADLVASGDSGPLHLAAALGRPVVGVYGPTDPRIHGPVSAAPVRVVRYDLPCSPCYSLAAVADCPLGDPICMRLVGVERVVDIALELFGLRDNSDRLRSKDELLVAEEDALQDPERGQDGDEGAAAVTHQW